MPAEARGALRVVLAHGTLQGGPVPEGETDAYPFSQADVESLKADYVALGHFHGIYPPWKTGELIERSVCYCGTHEPEQFGSEGWAILAEINKGQPTRLKRLKVARRQWRLVEITGPGDIELVESLRREVAASEQPGRYVIRLKTGARVSLPAESIEQLSRLENALRMLGSHVERRGALQARLAGQALDFSALPSGAVKEALLSLQAELTTTSDEGRREVLTAALQLGWEQMPASPAA